MVFMFFRWYYFGGVWYCREAPMHSYSRNGVICAEEIGHAVLASTGYSETIKFMPLRCPCCLSLGMFRNSNFVRSLSLLCWSPIAHFDLRGQRWLCSFNSNHLRLYWLNSFNYVWCYWKICSWLLFFRCYYPLPLFVRCFLESCDRCTQIVFNFDNVFGGARQVYFEWLEQVTASACSICACSKLNKSLRPVDGKSRHKILAKRNNYCPHAIALTMSSYTCEVLHHQTPRWHGQR